MSEQKYTGVYKQKNGKWAYRFVVFVDGKRIEKRNLGMKKGDLSKLLGKHGKQDKRQCKSIKSSKYLWQQ